MNFSVDILNILDENGKVDQKLLPKLENHELKNLFENMLLTRIVDDRILKLQREGRCGTYASSLGQEASQVGSAFALKDEDWMFPSFREAGSFVVRKFPIANFILYWMGDERGMKIPENSNNFMVCIPVSTQLLHAAGAAFAMKQKKEQKVVLAYVGDGGTSEGDFHEAMNFAGVFSLPLVIVCQNNHYAISMPVEKQTAAKTLAQKAIAYGFEGIRVDGNDVLAVYAATKAAIDKARSGKGPTFIECFTYRLSDHTTSDDATRYRSHEELEKWKRKDPIDRMRKYLQSKGLWTQQYEDGLMKDSQESAEQAIKEAESKPEQAIDDIFTHTYAQMPSKLQEQLKEAKGG